MPGRSTTYAISIEKTGRSDGHNTHRHRSKESLQSGTEGGVLERKRIVRLIHDMVDVRLHQVSALSPYRLRILVKVLTEGRGKNYQNP